jgi:probable phosphoglycerate mutase
VQWWIERAQEEGAGQPDPLEPRAPDARLQGLDVDRNVGQLGHQDENTPSVSRALGGGLRRDAATNYAAAMPAARRVPTTVLLLVRHARTPTTGSVLPGRTPGLHLSDEGRKEADAVAARIGPLKKVAAVYASPLERARETALPVARACGRALRIERGLIECDFGEWTGAKLSRLAQRPEWSVVQRYPSGFRFPGGESFPEMQTRIVSAIARLVQNHPGATVVAVSHADPIKAAVAHALGIHLDLFQRIAIATASITAIAYRREGPTVLTVNSPAGGLGMLGVA